MATRYWKGGSAAVAQVWDGTIDSVDGTPANNTFTVTIGGVAVSVPGNTSANQTATDLRAALNASTHPYFSGITWSGATNHIIGTADTAGVPFVAVLSKSGAGTGTVTNFSETTANSGPHDWDTAGNWSDGVAPTGSDVIIIANSDVDILWGLDQNTVDLTSLQILQTYTGKIGLPYNQFHTSEDGATANTGYLEYRETYLKIGAGTVDIGQHFGAGSPAGSTRIKLNNDKAGAAVTTIHRTASTSADSGFAAVRLKASHASQDFYIREAVGGVAFALDAPGETATIGDVYVSALDTSTRVFIGSGVTITTFSQEGGDNMLNAAATITSAEVNGGQLTIEGDYTITALNINGGTVYDNHIKTGGNSNTVVNLSAGTLDMTRSSEARTIAALSPDGGTLIADDAYVTITSLDDPAGKYTLTVS